MNSSRFIPATNAAKLESVVLLIPQEMAGEEGWDRVHLPLRKILRAALRISQLLFHLWSVATPMKASMVRTSTI